MDRQEDLAWELRGSAPEGVRFESETSDGVWLEKVIVNGNEIKEVLLLECGGAGIADRLRKANRRAKELGVPLKVVNGMNGVGNWSLGSGKKRLEPVPMMTLDEMDRWLERHYPRRKFFSVLY